MNKRQVLLAAAIASLSLANTAGAATGIPDVAVIKDVAKSCAGAEPKDVAKSCAGAEPKDVAKSCAGAAVRDVLKSCGESGQRG